MFAFKPSKDSQLKFRSESSGSEDPDASKRTFNSQPLLTISSSPKSGIGHIFA